MYLTVLGLLSAYLFYARVGDSARTFLMLDDQIRDWRIALGPFTSLPLVGTASTAGGSSLGPIYYWVLWLSRVVIGPFVHNQPHAGAYGLAVLQGLADLLLIESLRRRFSSTVFALAAVLATAGSAHDLAVSSTIWNPTVSVAFVKVALALELWPAARRSAWWTAGTVAAAWLAVQAHSSAIFVAAPLLANAVVRSLWREGLIGAAQTVRTLVEVVAVLQVPWLGHLLTHAGGAMPTRALSGATDAVTDGHLRLAEASRSLLSGLTAILTAPWDGVIVSYVLLLLVIVAAVRCRRDLAVVMVTVAPPLLAAFGFALWQGEYNDYWYLPLAPCLALAVVLGLTTWRPALASQVVLAALIVAQPWHLQFAWAYYRMPVYGALSAGSVRLARQAPSLRRVFTEFPMPMFSDETFPYEAAGGRMDGAAAFDGWIDAKGQVRFTPVPQGGR